METDRLTYWQAESLVVEGHLHKGKDICRKAGLKVVGNEKEGGSGMCQSVNLARTAAIEVCLPFSFAVVFDFMCFHFAYTVLFRILCLQLNFNIFCLMLL
jgi:hypothetical protein